MELQTRTAGNVQILDVSGRFDAYGAPKVVDWLNSVTASEPARALINLQGVTFVDSTALAALVQGMKHCRQRGGDLYLSNLQQPVRIIFELTRLNKAFEIFPDEAAALGAFEGQG